MAELTSAQKLAFIQASDLVGDRGDLGDSPRLARVPARATLGDSGRLLEPDKQEAAIAMARHRLEGVCFAPPAYPVDALGPLAEVCREIAQHGQLEPAMAGQCLLATASLLTQSLRRVRTLAGVKPISLYLQTIGDSGDGKSSAESVALAPVNEWQREQSRVYAQSVSDAQAPRAKGEQALELPRAPYRVSRDATVEGVRNSFQHGMPSQALFNSEAAAVLSGYGMKPEHRAKTAATFNGLWDSGEVSVSRSMAGHIQLYGRFLAVHWMIQPTAVRETLYDPLLSAIGLWPRFLIAWPAPMKPRLAQQFRPEKSPVIGRYWARCTELLRYDIGEDCADVPVIEFDADAIELAQQFFERMEQAARTTNGSLVSIKPFAVRATEQIFRVGAVLATFEGRHSVDLKTAGNAIALVTHSLEIWKQIFGNREEAEAHQHALELFEWLLKKPLGSVSETTVLHVGPKSLRSKSRRDTAIATLESAGLLNRIGGQLYPRSPDEQCA